MRGAEMSEKPVIRDENGKFVKGSGSANPGGRPRSDAARYLREAIQAATTPEMAAQIADTMVQRAAKGDWRAREALFKALGVNEPEKFIVESGAPMPEDWDTMVAFVRQRIEERKDAVTG